MRKFFMSVLVLLFCSTFLFSEETVQRYRYSYKEHDPNNSWIVVMCIIDFPSPVEDEMLEKSEMMPLNNKDEREKFIKAWGGYSNIIDAFEQGAYKGAYYDFTDPNNPDMEWIYGGYQIIDYINGVE